MTKRKRPEGEEWGAFVDEWYKRDHAGKMELIKPYTDSYDTAKHWLSENGATRRAEPNYSMAITADEVMAAPVETKMDFAFFDIEASNLDADFSIMLSAVIKPFGQEPVVFRADNYPEWKTNRYHDEGIVRDIANELKQHAVIVTHYGSSGYYDTPFLKAKMVKYRMPPLPSMFSVDTYRISRANFKLRSRRLGSMSKYYALGDKEEVEGALWVKAAYGNNEEAKAALDCIVAHNVQDVILLERLTCLIYPYLKAIPKL